MAREGSSKIGKKFQPWLEQQLNQCTIPGLMWVDRDKRIFCMPWKHHRPARHGEQDAFVLLQYAIALHQHEVGMEPQYSRWKTLMRNALRSLPYIKELNHLNKQDIEKPYNVYQFVDDNGRGTAAKKRRCDESDAVDGFDFPAGGNATLEAQGLPADYIGDYLRSDEHSSFADDFIFAATSSSSSEPSQDLLESSPPSNASWGQISGSQMQNADNGAPIRDQITSTSYNQSQVVPQLPDSQSMRNTNFLQSENLAGCVGFPSPSQLQVNHFLEYDGFCGASAHHETPFSAGFSFSSQTVSNATAFLGGNAFGNADQSVKSFNAARDNEQYTNSELHANIPCVVPRLDGQSPTGKDSGIPNFGELLSQNNEMTDTTHTSVRAGEFVHKKAVVVPPSTCNATQISQMGLVTHQSHAHQQVPVERLTVYGRNSEDNLGLLNRSCASARPIQNGHVFQAGAEGHCDQHPMDVFNNNVGITVYYYTSPILKKICKDPFRFCFDGSGIEASVLAKCSEVTGQEVKEVVKLPATDECKDLDPNRDVSKLNELLNNMELGVAISYKNNDIYARRLCKAHVLFYTPGETSPVSLPRREEKKIFSFDDHFKPHFENWRMSRQESKPRPPQSFVYLTFGKSNIHSSGFPHKSLVTVQVTHLLASKMLRDVAEDEFSKSNSDTYDHFIDKMRALAMEA